MTAIVLAVVLGAAPVPAFRVTPDRCFPGLQQQSGGQFAVYIFCDDAIGTNIGVVCTGPGMPPSEHWGPAKRFWQDAAWAIDVTSILWLPDNKLLVATSPVYGTGALYLLDLEMRTSRRLYPAATDSTEIIRISGVSSEGVIQFDAEDTVGEIKVQKRTVPLPGWPWPPR